MSSNEYLDTTFIQKHIEEKNVLSVYLSSGVCLIGTISEEDRDCFLLTIDRSDNKQLVYKQMVATISPKTRK